MLSRFRKRKRKSPRRRGTIQLEALEGRVLLDATSQWTQALGPWEPSDQTSLTDSLVEDLNHIFHSDNHEDGQAGIYYSDPTTWDLTEIFPDRRDLSIDELHHFVDAAFGYDDMGILTQDQTGSETLDGPSSISEPLSQNGGYTVHLDFDGGQFEGRDSDSWLYSYNAMIPSYDLSSYGWNGREAESIEMIVNFVQEDYAAYDVTITTQQPAAGEYTTIAVGGTNDWFRPNSGVIGVATYDVGNKYASNTGFAFVEELGVYYNSSGGSLHRFSEYVSNLVSHEVAHTFGANHISDTSAIMNPYLPLNPNTAMFGAGTVYGSSKTQDTQTQMGTNVGYAHGPDDYGDTQDSAQPVTVGSVIQAMLERRDDVDTFRFISPKSTTITINIDTGPFGNLDSQLSVHRWTDMNLLGQNDNNDTDKNASVSFDAIAGEEYLITVSSAAGNSSGRYALVVVNPQPEPNIRVTDSSGTSDDLTVDFGGLTVNTSAQEIVTIENTGKADLMIAQLTAGAGFELSIESAANYSSDDLVIEAGGQLTVVVTYHPQNIGSDTATLTIVSNDSDQAITQLSLAGFSHPPQPNLLISADGSPLSDGALDLGSILRGQSFLSTFLVTNDGLADLTITEILVADPVTLSAGWTGSPIQLTPGQNREISFSLTVDQRGLFESQILITSNDTDEPIT
ncbi:MAG: choice-of-anchor D domain-containing protein, partial [Planctomycetes bacterium]|nr:choice-of-anchor D domain-containing protein [Planctomycetota bacterium]